MRVFHQNLDRIGAQPFYYFPAAFLQAIKAHLHFLFAVDHGGRLCATHCYLEDDEVYFAFLCHGVQDAIGLRPNDFVYDAAIRDAQKRHFQFLHMGGGGPSLMAYKRKFSRMTWPFYIAGDLSTRYLCRPGRPTAKATGGRPDELVPFPSLPDTRLMDIVFITDRNQLVGMLAAMNSVIKNCCGERDLRFSIVSNVDSYPDITHHINQLFGQLTLTCG